jgi:hypothetical protein
MINKLRCIKRGNELKGTVAEMSEYVKNFLTKRFPSGLNDAMWPILSEMVLDAYIDGMNAQAAYEPPESLIIQP